MLKEHNLLGKMSVNEIFFELSKMERIVEKIVDLFKDVIPKDQIIVKYRTFDTYYILLE